MAEARPTPASAPSSSAAPATGSAAPRSLPPTLLLPRPSNGSRGAGGGSTAAGSGKKKKGEAAAGEGTMRRHDRLVEAARLVGGGVGWGRGVAGADILELAMAKGAMFSWLRYWPEEGYPKEDQPY